MKAPASGGRFWVLGPRMAQPEEKAWRRATGVVEARKEGVAVTDVETQPEKQERSRFDPRDCRDSEVWQKSLLQSKMQSYEFGRGAQTARG